MLQLTYLTAAQLAHFLADADVNNICNRTLRNMAFFSEEKRGGFGFGIAGLTSMYVF